MYPNEGIMIALPKIYDRWQQDLIESIEVPTGSL